MLIKFAMFDTTSERLRAAAILQLGLAIMISIWQAPAAGVTALLAIFSVATSNQELNKLVCPGGGDGSVCFLASSDNRVRARDPAVMY